MKQFVYKVMPVSDKLLSVLLSYSVLLRIVEGQGTIRPVNGDDPGVCEPLASVVCTQTNVGYSSTFVPNPRGHESQMEADGEIIDFVRLIETRCSSALYHFLCSYYFPFCFNVDNHATRLKICRSFCEFVRPACEPTINAFGYPWPIFLNCSLSDFTDEQPCFGPADPSNLAIPTIQLTVTPVRGLELPLTSSEMSTTPTITPTPPPQPTLPPSTAEPQLITTKLQLADNDMTTTKSSSVKARVLSKGAVLTASLALLICCFLQQ